MVFSFKKNYLVASSLNGGQSFIVFGDGHVVLYISFDASLTVDIEQCDT